MELKIISLREFQNLTDKSKIDDYTFAIRYSTFFNTPDDCLKIGDTLELEYGFIKDIQYDLQNEMTFSKQIEYISKVSKKDLKHIMLHEFTRTWFYLINEIEKLTKAENEKLSHTPTFEEQEAGLDRFDSLGIYLQIRKLCNGDITKYDSVRKLPYSLCFTELYAQKQEYEFNAALTKIYNSKNGRN